MTTNRFNPTPIRLSTPSRRLTRNQRANRGIDVTTADADIARWCDVAWTTTANFVAGRYRLEEHEANEIASDVVEQFLGRPSHWIAKYGDPTRFALAVARTRFLDWQGRERKQRGEGRTLVRDADGNGLVRRPVGSLVQFDQSEDDWTPVDVKDTDRDDFTETVAARVDLERAARVLSTDQAVAIEGLVLDDRTAVDVAAETGVAHTTAAARARKGATAMAVELGPEYELAG